MTKLPVSPSSQQGYNPEMHKHDKQVLRLFLEWNWNVAKTEKTIQKPTPE
jgi:hypothetical protein